MAFVGGAQPFVKPIRVVPTRRGGAKPVLTVPKKPLRPASTGGASPPIPKPVELNSVAEKPAPSPLDAQYYSSAAQDQFQANQQINALNAQSANDRSSLTETLRRLSQQQPVLRQNATNAANSQGLLYSGALGSQLGDIETAYLRDQGDANNQFAQAESDRQGQIAAIQQQLGFDDLAARLAAAERSSQRLETAPLVVPRVAKTGPGRPRAVAPKPTPSPRAKRKGK